MASAGGSSWDAFQAALDSFRTALRRSKSVLVGSSSLRDDARALVQRYFRELRPSLIALGCEADLVTEMDAEMQALLRLANGRNRRTSYVSVANALKKLRDRVEIDRELRLSEQASAGAVAVRPGLEANILATLQKLVPSAALSYEQALHDLAAANRISYRGTANDLRESLRETLDHLAPDEAVKRSPGFKFERDQSRPTQKQKVKHILRSRGASATAAKAPADAAALADELASSVARSSYQGTSVAAHVLTTRSDVLRMKTYVDSVLADLLELHR